jgi:hypothetical protein
MCERCVVSAGEIHNVLTVLRLNSQSGIGHGSLAQMEVEGKQ